MKCWHTDAERCGSNVLGECEESDYCERDYSRLMQGEAFTSFARIKEKIEEARRILKERSK